MVSHTFRNRLPFSLQRELLLSHALFQKRLKTILFYCGLVKLGLGQLRLVFFKRKKFILLLPTINVISMLHVQNHLWWGPLITRSFLRQPFLVTPEAVLYKFQCTTTKLRLIQPRPFQCYMYRKQLWSALLITRSFSAALFWQLLKIVHPRKFQICENISWCWRQHQGSSHMWAKKRLTKDITPDKWCSSGTKITFLHQRLHHSASFKQVQCASVNCMWQYQNMSGVTNICNQSWQM